jgi:hypothetical protein
LNDHLIVIAQSPTKHFQQLWIGPLGFKIGQFHPGDRIISILERFFFELVDQELKRLIGDLAKQNPRGLIVQIGHVNLRIWDEAYSPILLESLILAMSETRVMMFSKTNTEEGLKLGVKT